MCIRDRYVEEAILKDSNNPDKVSAYLVNSEMVLDFQIWYKQFCTKSAVQLEYLSFRCTSRRRQKKC